MSGDMLNNFNERLSKARKEFQDMINKHGWAVHFVPMDNNHVNIHTHGLQENYNHADLQITCPLPPKTAHSILAEIVHNVKLGERYKEGRNSRIIRNFDVELKEYMESGRKVLRILLPDTKGVLPTEQGCDPKFMYQLDLLRGD